MDFHFQRTLDGRPELQISMDHEAMAIWFNEELGDNRRQLEHLLQVVNGLINGQRWEYVDEGAEYSLRLTREHAEVRAALLDTEMMSEDVEGLDYYDSESISHCGLDDFQTLLLAWKHFISE